MCPAATESAFLTQLAQKEREAERGIVRARADADRILEEARAEAARIIEEARAERGRRGARSAVEMRERTRARADRRVAEVDEECRRLEGLSQEDLGRMAEEVIEEIFQGFTVG